jgi:hypothetical protein
MPMSISFFTIITIPTVVTCKSYSHSIVVDHQQLRHSDSTSTFKKLALGVHHKDTCLPSKTLVNS